MILYFAGAENASKRLVLLEGGASSVLFVRGKETEGVYGASFERRFLDSGAYSAYTQGRVLDVDEYCDYIHARISKLTTYAMLDVIGDWRATLVNLERMRARGLKPLWVYHALGNVPLSLLDEMCASESYVALGGMAGTEIPVSEMGRHLDKCFNIIAKHRTRIHGFGMNVWRFLTHYPFYSVDATSWMNPHIYGQHFDFVNGRLKRLSHKQVHTFRFLDKQAQLVASVKEFVKAEQYLTALWAKRGVVWQSNEGLQ